jgi:WD40 repeat protein
MSVSWSPDGTRIASGADDGVRVWDAAAGRCIFAFYNHPQGASVSLRLPSEKRPRESTDDIPAQKRIAK